MDKPTFIKAMLFPAIILLGFIGYNYYTLNMGEEILLKTAPVDPRDIFRGDYVNLRYDISSIDLSNISRDGNFNDGDDIYAVLMKGDKFWNIRTVFHFKPSLQSNEVCIKGKVTSSFNDNVIVNWGIESYFVPESKGMEIEKDIRNVSVKVSVDRNCRALIKELYIKDKPVVFGN
jgi:uncharacterized membrane-anchored protein